MNSTDSIWCYLSDSTYAARVKLSLFEIDRDITADIPIQSFPLPADLRERRKEDDREKIHGKLHSWKMPKLLAIFRIHMSIWEGAPECILV